jgi:hypothetical protein
MRFECANLKLLLVPAFLGDRWEQSQLVSYHGSVSPHVQTFWTAEYHYSYIKGKENWLLQECPGLSQHSYSTLHEALLFANVTYRSRWLHPGRHWN